jgi:hypothetical protein
MKKISISILISAILFLFLLPEIFCKDFYTLTELGLKYMPSVSENIILTGGQKDTVVIGLFNYEDHLLDIAILKRSQNVIEIYKNCGNGKLTISNILIQPKTVRKIEGQYKKTLDEGPGFGTDLKLFYEDGTEGILTNFKINQRESRTAKVPQWDPLNDPRVFLYGISFIEQWRSERSGQPQYNVAVEDLDNDGKNEVAYTFFPINDSIVQWKPSRLVIFECVSQDQYRIDWDTILLNGGFNMFNAVTDFNKDGNKEFFGWGYDIWNRLGCGVWEYNDSGSYRFKGGELLGIYGNVFDIELVDSMYYQGSYRPVLWRTASQYSGSGSRVHAAKYLYMASGYNGFGFIQLLSTEAHEYVYSMSASDIDGDGKTEIVLGYQQWGSNNFKYLDSTGQPLNMGYAVKGFQFPNEPIAAGYSINKDFDNDGVEEVVLCGPAWGTGSIGIVKHTGQPGENNFVVVWWDSVGIVAGPNMGIDSGFIDGQYSILYPCVRSQGPVYFLNINIFTRNGIHSFYKSCLQIIDSGSLVNARLYDIDKDNKMNIISAGGFSGPPFKFGAIDLEQVGVIGIGPIINEIPIVYELQQNYPNPFNPVTNIKFHVSSPGRMKIIIYDITGREVRTLINEKLHPGTYKAEWNASAYSSGVYFYSLIIDGKRMDTKKMILIK